MNTDRNLYLVTVAAMPPRVFLVSADAAPLAGASLARAAVSDLVDLAEDCRAEHLGACLRDTCHEVQAGNVLHALCSSLALVTNPDAEPAQADAVDAELRAALLAASDSLTDDEERAPVSAAARAADLESAAEPALVRTGDTFAFVAGGVQVTYPAESTCGRFLCTPKTYGFEVWQTGGGCTAWGRAFTLDGAKVDMLITHPEGLDHDFTPGEPCCIGVYDENHENFTTWVQSADCNPDTGERVPPVDVVHEGELPARRCPSMSSADFLPAVVDVARAFAVCLAEDIGADGVREAVRLNAAYPSRTVCHSHAYCDANMTMARAFAIVGFETAGGVPERIADYEERHEASCELWGTAWDMAKACDFDAARIAASAPLQTA